MIRLIVLTVVSGILFVGQLFAGEPPRTERATASRAGRADISRVPADQLSSLFNFPPGVAPDFMKSLKEAERKAKLPADKRHNLAETCHQALKQITFLPQPKPIQVKPLPEILEATNRLGISEDNVRYTLAAYQSHGEIIRNNRFMTIVEYGRNANTPRMFIIDLVTANIKKYNVTHGENSGPAGGPAKRFSNTQGSNASSLGCALTGAKRHQSKKHNTSLRLHGLEVGKNDNMCTRTVIMHAALTKKTRVDYAAGGGRSHGCPAVRPHERDEIFNQIVGGSMYCAFSDVKDNRQLAADGERERSRRTTKRSRRRG